MLRVLALLPLPLGYLIFGLLARLLRLFGWRRSLVDDGLARCLPELDPAARSDLARDFYGSLGRLAAEVARASRIPAADLEERLRFENPEVITSGLADGGRVLLLAAHHCNWEWLLLRCSSAFGTSLTAAYKPASRAPADHALRTMRSRFGATLVPAKELVPHLIAARGQARLLAMVADQSPSARSDQQAWLPFFGRETSFFRGPGWISARMGFKPFFVAMRPDGRGRYVARFVPLAGPAERPDPDRVLRAYVEALEAQVRAHPAEYFWAYNRWKRAKGLYD